MLTDLSARAFGLFNEAAERQRALAAWEASGSDEGMPLGATATAGSAIEAVSAWRAEAAYQDVLTEAPENPDPVDGEPEGLSPELSLLYRQFSAQVAEVSE